MSGDMVYQYAVKLLLGFYARGKESEKDPLRADGRYFTNVNVHNPWRHKVSYFWKVAASGRNGVAGRYTKWTPCSLNADEATDFCSFDLTGLSAHTLFFDGYFVIESEEELDVVGVYTTERPQEKGVATMHMERVPARRVCRPEYRPLRPATKARHR